MCKHVAAVLVWRRRQDSTERRARNVTVLPFCPLVKAYRTGTRHSWTDDELAQFERRWPLGTRERLAFSLLLYTAQRAGDIVKMRRSDLSDGLVRVVQQKTGAELSIPLHPALLAAIKAARARGVTLIGDTNGRPIQRATLTLIMRKAVELAGLPSRCVPHGLRKGDHAPPGREWIIRKGNCSNFRTPHPQGDRAVRGVGQIKSGCRKPL